VRAGDFFGVGLAIGFASGMLPFAFSFAIASGKVQFS
jgi:hypothetical protein